MILDSNPFNVLVIGRTQQGKSSFIEKLQSLAIDRHDEGPGIEVGQGTFSTTKDVTIYPMTLSLTGHELIDQSGNEVTIPRDEKIILQKLARDPNLSVQPIDTDAPLIHLNLIDTPGLDDSFGRDAEHIRMVLEALARNARSDNPSFRYISTILLIIKEDAVFNHTFQTIYEYYGKCMPNLFRGAAIVNTNFTVETWRKLYQSYAEDSGNIFTLGSRFQRSAKVRYMLARHNAFTEVFKHSRRHFFIDSKPRQKYAFEELKTRESVSEILHFIAAQGNMPIQQMRLCKFPAWLSIDAVLIGWLRSARNHFVTSREERLYTASNAVRAHAIASRNLVELDAAIQKVNDELAIKDVDTQYTLTSKSTDDASLWALIGSMAMFSTVEGTLQIEEKEVSDFQVEANDSNSGTWLDRPGVDYTKMTWTGTYKSKFYGKTAQLEARSYTTSKIYHASRLKELHAEKNNLLERREDADFTLKYQTRKDASNGSDVDIQRLDKFIILCDKIVKKLEASFLPLGDKSNMPAFERYQLKDSSELQPGHLSHLARAEDEHFAFRLMDYMFPNAAAEDSDQDDFDDGASHASDELDVPDLAQQDVERDKEEPLTSENSLPKATESIQETTPTPNVEVGEKKSEVIAPSRAAANTNPSDEMERSKSCCVIL